MTYSEELAAAPVRLVGRVPQRSALDDVLRDQLEYLMDARHNAAASARDCDRLMRVMNVLLEAFLYVTPEWAREESP